MLDKNLKGCVVVVDVYRQENKNLLFKTSILCAVVAIEETADRSLV